MKIKCVVACRDSNGGPSFFACSVAVKKKDYDEGAHYEAAAAKAEDAGYEGPFVAFDENDGPDFLFAHFFPQGGTA